MFGRARLVPSLDMKVRLGESNLQLVNSKATWDIYYSLTRFEIRNIALRYGRPVKSKSVQCLKEYLTNRSIQVSDQGPVSRNSR